MTRGRPVAGAEQKRQDAALARLTVQLAWWGLSAAAGRRVAEDAARVVFKRRIGEKRIEQLVAQIGPGKPLYGKPMLNVVSSSTKYSPQARLAVRGMSSEGQSPALRALVIESAPQRIVLGFMLRVGLNGARAGGGEMKVFGKEAEAIGWLDEELTKRAQTQGNAAR